MMQRPKHLDWAMLAVGVVTVVIAFFTCVAAYLALPQIQLFVAGSSRPNLAQTALSPTVVSDIAPTGTPTVARTAVANTVPTATPLQLTPTPSLPLATANATLNVRTGPGTIYPVLAKLKEGDQRIITGKSQDGQWWQIDLDGRAGWISSEFATTNLPTDNLPIVLVQSPTPPPTTKLPLAAPTAGVANLTGRVASDIPGTRLGLGSTVSSVVDSKTKPLDVYAIDLVAGQGVRFTVTSSEYLYLNLYNPGSRSIETRNVSSAFNEGGANKWIRDYVPAVSGTYYFAVGAGSTGQTYTFIAQ